jgi:hypothetical protein
LIFVFSGALEIAACGALAVSGDCDTVFGATVSGVSPFFETWSLLGLKRNDHRISTRKDKAKASIVLFSI